MDWRTITRCVLQHLISASITGGPSPSQLAQKADDHRWPLRTVVVHIVDTIVYSFEENCNKIST